MSATLETDASTELDMTAPLPIISTDNHVGPLPSQLREYCPKEHLEAFDAYMAEARALYEASLERGEQLGQVVNTDDPDADELKADYLRIFDTEGHHDMDARLRDMDWSGMACQVIYQSSANGQPIPFIPHSAGGYDFFFNPTGGELEMCKVGFRIYNSWLADAVSVAPERLIGLAHLPAWDIEATVAEVQWAADHGLRGASFNNPRPGITTYDDPAWEPLWALCEERDISLNCHAGAATEIDHITGPHMMAMRYFFNLGWSARKALPLMVFAGVFERHPGLKLVLAEQPGVWWTNQLREFDSAWHQTYHALKGQVPRAPSEYCSSNVFLGSSFMARHEALDAIENGYVGNVMWGQDYPHPEGLFRAPRTEDDVDFTLLSLRNTFAGIDPHHVRQLLVDTPMQVFGLDRIALEKVAARIMAPSLADIDVPVREDELPKPTMSLGFRSFGPYS
jgi:predicted TIM-barrel fold metal-dependent hydrolase